MTGLIREVCCALNILIYMTKISCVVANIEQNGVKFVIAGGPLAVPLMSVEIERDFCFYIIFNH